MRRERLLVKSILTIVLALVFTASAVSAATIDNVYVGTSDGNVYMLDSSLGATGNSFDTGTGLPVTSLAVLPNGNVAIGAGRYAYLRNPDLSIIGGETFYDVGAAYTVTSLAAQSDNDVVVGTSWKICLPPGFQPGGKTSCL